MSELLKINVNDHTEKKNGLTYLSWAWAWAEVLKIDPGAIWVPMGFGPDRVMLCEMPDGTALVGIGVTIKGITRTCMLPVMDHRNKAIPKPNAFDVNKAMMRCLAKAIAMHGLGLYIYAGEDLPESDEAEPEKPNSLENQLKASIEKLRKVDGIKPTADAGLGMSEEKKSELDDIAMHLIDLHKAGKDMDAIRIWYEPATFADNDERAYVWSRMATESKLRSTIKANNPHKEPVKQ